MSDERSRPRDHEMVMVNLECGDGTREWWLARRIDWRYMRQSLYVGGKYCRIGRPYKVTANDVLDASDLAGVQCVYMRPGAWHGQAVDQVLMAGLLEDAAEENGRR